MVQPGSYGRKCDKLLEFDDVMSNLSADKVIPASPPHYRDSEVGSKSLFCLSLRVVIRELHVWMRSWLGAEGRQRAAGHQSALCFGCHRVQHTAQPIGCCQGHGKCMHGWCACDAGFFGPDCAHTVTDELQRPPGTAMRSHRTTVSIFVYELPPSIAFRFGRRIDPNYMSEWAFIDRLLGDHSARTLNPEDADLFLVPFLSVFGHSSNRLCDRARLELAVHWLRSRHPYYDRSGGRDHVFFLTGDRGACGMGSAGVGPIFVTHFGLLGPYRTMKTVADSGMTDAVLQQTSSELAAVMSSGKWCYAPHKDILAPPYYSRSPTIPREGLDRGRGVRLLVHSGGIWGASGIGKQAITFYSMGVRQRLFLAFGRGVGRSEDARVAIMNTSFGKKSMSALMGSSDFCLAPSGDGWGMRLTIAAIANCLPLIMQPQIEQPLEGILNFDDISRRISLQGLTGLPMALAAHSNDTIRRMHRRLALVAPAFSWAAEQGLGYNFTLLGLCQRAMELRGSLLAGPHAGCSNLAAALPGAHATWQHPSWYPNALVEARHLAVAQRRL